VKSVNYIPSTCNGRMRYTIPLPERKENSCSPYFPLTFTESFVD
jgi:hypothetical protein